jgi:magnesium chelatase subunit D
VTRGADIGAEVLAWTDATWAAALLALDCAELGGVWVRARPGPVRDRWLALLRELLPLSTPWRRAPLHIADGRLLGGLDLTATLAAGRPVAERGLLAEADGGIVVFPMAERLSASTAARIAAVLDTGEVALERDGLALRTPARLGMVAFDESTEDDEAPSQALLDRVAFHIDLNEVSVRDVDCAQVDAQAVATARTTWTQAYVDDSTVHALTAAAAALGIASLRPPVLALRAARMLAALDHSGTVTPQHAALAARLVLAPRATVMPSDEPSATPDAPEPPESSDGGRSQDEAESQSLDDVVLAAARAAIPAGLLARLAAVGMRSASRTRGRSGALQMSRLRGRPIGTRRGELRAGSKLNLIETLRAAAPWQSLRRAEANRAGVRGRVDVRPDDFRVVRFKQRRQTTTIFVVDASGSQALHRLAEAKGAVELLLADCYVRRDRVALIAFRGKGAELMLPPTRSLARAKRGLAGMPGGGGTPLAAGFDAAAELADVLKRRGDSVVVVFLTDGRANVARNPEGGRPAAEAEAAQAARALRGVRCLLVDTSPRPQPAAARLAEQMQAQYLALPHLDATALSGAVQAAARASSA